MTGYGEWKDIAPMLEDALNRDGAGICLCRFDGSVIYVNRNFIALFKKEADSIPALKKISDISHALGEILATVGKGKQFLKRELFVSDETGSTRRLSCTACAVYTAKGGDAAAVFIVHDITPHQYSEGDGIWYAIVDSLEDGYYECDLAGCFRYVNSAYCNIFEYPRDQIIGMSYRSFYQEEEAKKIYDIFHYVYVTGTPTRLTDFTGVAKSGRKKRIEGSISPIRDDGGVITGFRGIIRDLTERNRIEKELQRARKLEAIGILAGGIAHDYNNALTAIMGNISLAKMEVSPDNAALMEFLSDAEEASLKAVELTRRLSTFARGGKPERRIIDYTDSLRATVDSVLGRYPGTYKMDIQNNLWKVDVDEFQIDQVITYILDNAVESMARPGAIYVSAENVVVDQEESHHELTLQPGNFVRISIRDEGSGMPPDELVNIFDPYYTTKEMASGMGLATSYVIIKRHHGYIDVKSSMGQGSTFFVYLPVAQA